MKKAKKLASLLLALVMMLALAVPAMAAGEGTITLDNPRAGVTYTAYKIFDVTYNTDKSAYSYTISGTSEWFGVVASVNAETGAVTSNVAGLTFTKAANEDRYVVAKDGGFSAAAFAETLKAKVVGDSTDATIVATGKQLGDATVDGKTVKQLANLDLGYYFVASTSGALCNLTTTNPAVTIHDKNDVPFEKTADVTSVEVGQTVTYTITGKVPDTTGFTTYTYTIADTVSDGLNLNQDVTVTIGGTPVTVTPTYTTADGRTSAFELTIPVMDYQAKVGQSIVVTYTAVVNEKAVAVISTNTAKLTYSNNPVTGETGTPITPDPVPVYSAKIVIDKYAANPENTEDTATKLANAKFVLYKEEPAGTKMYYKYDGDTKAVSWVANQTDATEVTTDNNGAAEFIGLKDGAYKLLETAAPAGYNLLEAPVEITINGASATAENLAALTHTEKVANNTGAMLPSTGGIGTTIFYVLGGLLAVGAAVLLVTKKRMSAEK